MLGHTYDEDRWEHHVVLPLLGPTLEKIIRASAMSGDGPCLAPLVARDVFSGLAYLHGRGIAHRDIKPANILLGFDHRFKLIDHGTAFTVQHTSSAGSQSGSLADGSSDNEVQEETPDRMICQVGTGCVSKTSAKRSIQELTM